MRSRVSPFSPLHNGEAVASPCGTALEVELLHLSVSYITGKLLHPTVQSRGKSSPVTFSPLHNGEAVASPPVPPLGELPPPTFSPLHNGEAVASAPDVGRARISAFLSVPYITGKLLHLVMVVHAVTLGLDFQSPT